MKHTYDWLAVRAASFEELDYSARLNREKIAQLKEALAIALDAIEYAGAETERHEVTRKLSRYVKKILVAMGDEEEGK